MNYITSFGTVFIFSTFVCVFYTIFGCLYSLRTAVIWSEKQTLLSTVIFQTDDLYCWVYSNIQGQLLNTFLQLILITGLLIPNGIHCHKGKRQTASSIPFYLLSHKQWKFPLSVLGKSGRKCWTEQLTTHSLKTSQQEYVIWSGSALMAACFCNFSLHIQ